MVLLGFGFNGESRDRVRRELSELQADGVIALGRDDKWRAVWRLVSDNHPDR
jgi:hypothetical protein